MKTLHSKKLLIIDSLIEFENEITAKDGDFNPPENISLADMETAIQREEELYINIHSKN